MELLMEACTSLIQRRRRAGLNRTASSRQWVFVIDFDGFALLTGLLDVLHSSYEVMLQIHNE